MRLEHLRAVPYAGVVMLVVGIAVWSGQDISGAWIIGSYCAVGLFLAWRRPREVVGWLLVAFALAFETLGTVVPGPSSQVVDGHADAGITLMAWTNSWGSGLAFGVFVALAVLFPAGRFPAGRLGTVGRLAVAVPIVFAIVLAFAPDATVNFTDGIAVAVRLPFGIAPDWPGWPVIQTGVFVAVLIALAAAIGTLIVRFRRAEGAEREQYKWLLAALAVTLGTVVFAFAVILLVDTTGTWMWWPAVIAYPLIPIAIAIAITRYRLYEIDRIVSRTIGWAIVTGILVAVFAGLVVALQTVLAPVTNENTLAVAASTLVAFALFQPLRRRVQRVVDRRFDRARYDGQRTADAFAERLRNEIDVNSVHDALVATTSAAVKPAAAGIWLRNASSDSSAQPS